MSEDRPQYAAKPVGHPRPTNAEIADMLRALVHEMRDIGGTMDYLGGMGLMAEHGRMLVEQAAIVSTWAQEIEGAQG